MKNNRFLEKKPRRMALVYIFANLFNISFNGRQLDSHVVLFEVCEENLALHK